MTFREGCVGFTTRIFPALHPVSLVQVDEETEAVSRVSYMSCVCRFSSYCVLLHVIWFFMPLCKVVFHDIVSYHYGMLCRFSCHIFYISCRMSFLMSCQCHCLMSSVVIHVILSRINYRPPCRCYAVPTDSASTVSPESRANSSAEFLPRTGSSNSTDTPTNRFTLRGG